MLERAESVEALLCVLVSCEVPVLVCEAPVPVVPEALGGVKGAVTPNPGSSALGTEAANASNVLSPVVGGLIAPYMPPLQ